MNSKMRMRQRLDQLLWCMHLDGNHLAVIKINRDSKMKTTMTMSKQTIEFQMCS